MRFRLPIAAAVALLGTAVPAAAAEFTIDPEHTPAVFMVNHLGYSNMIGRFNEVSGSFTFDENAPEAASVTLKVAPDSVDTNHQRPDDPLRSPDFFNLHENGLRPGRE